MATILPGVDTNTDHQASEAHSYAMQSFNASRSDWQLTDDGTSMPPVKA
jgi:hypothetical protein